MIPHVLGWVRKGNTVHCMGRIIGWTAAAITQATISTITYSVFALDPDDEDSETVQEGHEDVSVTIASAVYDTYQTGGAWTEAGGDATGYNFAHTVPIAVYPAFPVRGVDYLIRFSLTPTSGQVIDVPFRVNAV